MPYIRIDPDGDLTVHVVPVTAGGIRAAVGEPGFDQVRLRRDVGMRGYVNDAFQALDLPRNPIGALVLVQLGAYRQVYAGPIVIAGWDVADPLDELTDLTEVAEGQVQALWRIAMEGAANGLVGYVNEVLTTPFRGLPSDPAGSGTGSV